jgi:hypothetical protein
VTAPRADAMVVGLAAALGVGCNGSGNLPGQNIPGLIFATEVQKTYAAARACRSPGEHSGLNAFSVWVSKDAESAFSTLWHTPPGIDRLPDGTVVVKEVYSGPDCVESQVERWVAMRKERGFDPAHADWHWQEVRADGHVTVDGAAQACIGCHRGGADATCTGYGELNGRDYTCTVPDADAGR